MRCRVSKIEKSYYPFRGLRLQLSRLLYWSKALKLSKFYCISLQYRESLCSLLGDSLQLLIRFSFGNFRTLSYFANISFFF
jgi:hypothetical protein